MVEYRSFHNSDPPKLVKLWHECRLGRGAADGFTYDALETFVLSQPYFDPDGLIVAWEGPEVIGFVHAGFGPNEDESALSHERGVICAVLVHPDCRRSGIGRELVARAERYLQDAGAASLQAGPSEPLAPFYVGLYGGSEPAGFLESDPDAGPFFQALGYVPVERHFIYQRSTAAKDPVSFRLVTVRRKMQISISQNARRNSWWWTTRYGRLDTLQFQLIPKGGGAPVAEVTAVGLDLYIPKWRQRAVGLTDLFVPETERRQGYAQTLVVEAGRRLKEEFVGLLEGHAAEDDPTAAELLKSAGFEPVDTGIVYRRPERG